mgnify:CR=1 FL=1
MAKKRKAKQSRPGAAKQQNTSSVESSMVTKGMVKDTDGLYHNKQTWNHAINLVNHSTEGNIGTVGNEPANYKCADVPGIVIGAIHLYGDEWIIFSVDGLLSHIGRFNESECIYTSLIVDACLSFSTDHLITGAAKENYDCSYQIYFDDGLNPSRTINLDNIPYVQEIVSAPGDPCVEFAPVTPLQLDCERIRLAPLIDVPCVKLSKAPEAGSLRNGSYQVFIAYTVNDQKIGDYYGISNVQSLWTHEDTSSSLIIDISNLDSQFDFFEIVIVSNVNMETSARRLGYYSIGDTSLPMTIKVDFINQKLQAVNLGDLPARNPAYEKSSRMFVVNDYLIRSEPTEQFDFNYQPLANRIHTHWVSVQYPADYYKKGGNKPTFMRDEVYAFFIRFIYNTGERSASYHIPGRRNEALVGFNSNPLAAPTFYTVIGGDINALDTTDQLFKVYNTADAFNVGSLPQDPQAQASIDDGGVIIGRGHMGYWESTELYPQDPERWNSNVGIDDFDLCGKPIRHHKFPDESISPSTQLSTPDGRFINILGVRFMDIAWPRDNDNNLIPNIVGYEILTGSREGNKSIIAKGIMKDTIGYTPQDGGGSEGSTVNVLPNYPYNDRQVDPYLTSGAAATNFLGQVGPTGFPGNSPNGPDFNTTPGLTIDQTARYHTFHSPETMFNDIYLNPSEVKIYGNISGTSSGQFIPSEEHPGHILLRNIAALVALFIGVGYAFHSMRGSTNRKIDGGKILSLGQRGIAGGSEVNTLVQGVLVGGNGTSGTSGNINTNVTGGEAPINPAAIGGGQAPGIGANAGLAATADAAETGATTTLRSGLSLVAPLGGDGAAFDIAYPTWSAAANGSWAAVPGALGPSSTVELTGSRFGSMPNAFQIISGLYTFLNFTATGGQEIVDLIYNLSKPRVYAYKYNSHGFYRSFNTYNPAVDSGGAIANTVRYNVDASRYIKNSISSLFDSTAGNTVTYQNLFRPATVALITQNPVTSNPAVGADGSKFIIGNFGGWSNPSTPVQSPISTNYAALKINFDNQYGQLDSIRQIPIKGCVQHFRDQFYRDENDVYQPIDMTTVSTLTEFTTGVLFGGDTYINRYTEKSIMPFWYDFLKGEPDMIGYDYRLKSNIPFPRFWMDTNKYRLDEMVKPLMNLNFNFSTALPNDYWHLDRDPVSTFNVGGASGFGNDIGGQQGPQQGGNFGFQGQQNVPTSGNVPGGLFVLGNAYMYTHCSGINDFFVESSMNLDFRDFEDPPEKRFYDYATYTDVKQLFHADIIKMGNFYKYDPSLSIDRFFTKLISFGEIQPRDYNPEVAETCYTYYPKRLIYSLQAQKESKRDFWRVFLPLNYNDFKDRVNTIKPISEYGALILFPRLSPMQFRGVDLVTTDLGTKITLGDGELFNMKNLKNVVNSDVSHEYGSCESSRSVLNTPSGVFYISQEQGKIFQYDGRSLVNIANFGMKNWFNKYLPSKLLQSFPGIEDYPEYSDNPVNAAGCQTVYDINNDIVYFCKKDYIPKSELKECIEFDPELGFVYNITECEGAAQISECPDGFTFNNATGLCERTFQDEAFSVQVLDTEVVLAQQVGNPLVVQRQQVWRYGKDCPLIINRYNGNGVPVDAAGNVSTNIQDVKMINGANNTNHQSCTASPSGYGNGWWVDMPAPGGQTGVVNQLSVWAFDNLGNSVASLQYNFAVTIDGNEPNFNSDPNFPGTLPLYVLLAGDNSFTLSTDINGAGFNTVVNVDPNGATGAGTMFGTAGYIENNLEPICPDGGCSNYTMQYGDDSVPYQRAFIYRINLPIGCTKIRAVANDNSTPGAFACALFNNTEQELIDSNNLEELNDIFRSDTGQAFQNAARFVCPPGYATVTTPPFSEECPDCQRLVESFELVCGEGGTLITLPSGDDICEYLETVDPEKVDQVIPIDLTDSTYFDDVSWTVSFDPKTKSWVSFHDWHPDLTFNSIDHFLTTKEGNRIAPPSIVEGDIWECPPGYTPISLADGTPACRNINNPSDIIPLEAGLSTGIWKHNDRNDLFVNFYDEDYPWEIDLIESTGINVNTVRSIEYELESYVYKNFHPSDPFNGSDRFHRLDFNFDEAIIYNSEQVSGLLKLNISPKNNAPLLTTYPIIGLADIQILYSKEEQKYRFNQFWDITNDRGEFTNTENSIFITRLNGYVKDLNAVNLNYNKLELEHKKFRHYQNNIIFRRTRSGNTKMLLKISNTKLNLSFR